MTNEELLTYFEEVKEGLKGKYIYSVPVMMKDEDFRRERVWYNEDFHYLLRKCKEIVEKNQFLEKENKTLSAFKFHSVSVMTDKQISKVIEKVNA